MKKYNKHINKIYGSIFELFCCDFLSNNNYYVLDINYNTKYGEVDAIAIDYNNLVYKLLMYLNKNRVASNIHNNKINDSLIRNIFQISRYNYDYSIHNYNFNKKETFDLTKYYDNFLYSTFNDVDKKYEPQNLFSLINGKKLFFLEQHATKKINTKKFIDNYNQYCSLIFIEIKSKTTNFFGSPEDMISTKKVKNIHRLSTLYPHYKKLPKRLDVIAISSQKHIKKPTKTKLKPNTSLYYQTKLKPNTSLYYHSKLKSNNKLMSLNNSSRNNNMKKCDKHKTLKIKQKTLKINDLFLKKVTLKHYKNVYK